MDSQAQETVVSTVGHKKHANRPRLPVDVPVLQYGPQVRATWSQLFMGTISSHYGYMGTLWSHYDHIMGTWVHGYMGTWLHGYMRVHVGT